MPKIAKLLLGLGLALQQVCWAQPPRTAEEGLPEQRFIYSPTRGRTVDPKSLGLGLVDRYFPSSAGVRLNAWWLAAPVGRPTFLYFHGQGGSLSNLGGQLRLYQQAKVGALVVDYRGYGLSQGYPSEPGLYEDARAAYRECRRLGISAQDVIIHGHSLGGAVAVQLASEQPSRGLIMESSFTDLPAMARRLHGEAAVKQLHSRFPSLQTIARVKCPVLVLHGDADDLIPCSMGQQLYAAAPQPKSLWIVKGAGHGDLHSRAGAEYLRRLQDFAASTPARLPELDARRKAIQDK